MMIDFRRFCPIASLFAYLIVQASLHAQGLGTIVGTITDESGAVVPGAKVKITDEGTSTAREATSSAQGYYVFPALRPSTYTLLVEAAGFAQTLRKGIVLQADESATVNLTLSVQQSTQAIEIRSEAPQVNTTTATNSEVVDQRRVVELPLNGRNAASLLLVVAGATPAPGTDVDQGNTKTFPATVTVSTNGSRQNQVSFRLDGANNNDLYTNVNQPFPFPDALQEFSVQTSNYSAKYGGNAGGVVNVVTKSGTNELHGGAVRVCAKCRLQCPELLCAQRDQLKRNQFGGTIGGPIVIPKLIQWQEQGFLLLRISGHTHPQYRRNLQRLCSDRGECRTATSRRVLERGQSGQPVRQGDQIIDPKTGQPFPEQSDSDRAGSILPR